MNCPGGATPACPAAICCGLNMGCPCGGTPGWGNAIPWKCWKPPLMGGPAMWGGSWGG